MQAVLENESGALRPELSDTPSTSARGLSLHRIFARITPSDDLLRHPFGGSLLASRAGRR